MNNMEIVKTQMGPVAIDCNYRNNNNWGILFNTIQTPVGHEWGVAPQHGCTTYEAKDEAWIVGESFMCRWTDFGKFDFNSETPFLNFDENMWTRNTLSTSIDTTMNKIMVTPQMLHERLERVRPKSQEELASMAEVAASRGEFLTVDNIPAGANIKIRIPYGNLYNLIAKNPSKQLRDRIRIIIKSNTDPMKDVVKGATLLITDIHPIHGLVMKIYEPARQQLFPNISPDKFYTISPNSTVDMSNMAPGQMYQCFFPGSENENMSIEEILEKYLVVDVRYRIFKGIEILSHTSDFGFLMNETIEDVLDSKNYKNEDVLRVPYINPFESGITVDTSYFDFAPIHLDCNILFSILDLYKGFEWIDINVSQNPYHPILITGVKEDAGFPTIQSVIAPLKIKKGDVR